MPDFKGEIELIRTDRKSTFFSQNNLSKDIRVKILLPQMSSFTQLK